MHIPFTILFGFTDFVWDLPYLPIHPLIISYWT